MHTELAAPGSTSPSFVRLLRAALVVVFAAAGVFYIAASLDWQMMVDSPIMHYVNFLREHGLRPYADITDMNMPGSYLMDALEMHIFGPGDLALRVYSFFLGGVLISAMMIIADPWDRLAGLYAGGLFVLLQGAEGPKLAVEREQVLTTLMFVGYALLFTAVRRRRPLLAFPFGLCAGMCATIKPTVALLPVALLLLLGFVLHRRRVALVPYLGWSVLGMTLAVATSIGFLAHYNAFGPFALVLERVLPAYASMKHPTPLQMWQVLVPFNVLFLLPFGAVAYWTHTRREGGWNWEQWALALGAGMGLVSYFAQNKGFLHHRYLFLCFLLLLLGLELVTALGRPGVARIAGAAGLLFTLLLMVPRYILFIHRVPPSSPYTVQLERDLDRLGAPQLQQQVFCMDLVYGCLNSLYHLDLVENTGYTGDLLLFSPVDGPAVRFYRHDLQQRQAAHPATVFVVSNEWLERPNTYAKLDTWPWFEQYLAANYTEVVARSFPMEGRRVPPPPDDPIGPPGYRIYVRNGSPLLADAKAELGG